MRFRYIEKAFAALVALLIILPCWANGHDFVKAGQAAERAGNRNAALEAYDQAIQAGDLPTSQLSFVHYRRGSIHGFLGNNINGINEFSKSIELNPQHGESYSLRGYLRGTVGQYALAEKDHKTAMSLTKYAKWANYQPWVLQHYADLWRRRGNYDKALAHCEKALKLANFSSAYFRRAWIYLDMGRPTEARADFEKFEQEMKLQGISYDVFWPDERGAISRLRELR